MPLLQEEQQHQEDNRDAIEAAKFAEEMERKWEAEASAWRAEQAALGLSEVDNPFAQVSSQWLLFSVRK